MQTSQDALFPSPLQIQPLHPPLHHQHQHQHQQALASPLLPQQHQPQQPQVLASPLLQQPALQSPLQRRALASPLESPLRATFAADPQFLEDVKPPPPTATAAHLPQHRQPQAVVPPPEGLSPAAVQGAEIFRQIFSLSFATQEEGFEACRKLARKCGFGIRRRTSKATTVYIVCSREGRPEQKKEGVRKRNRISERCNCDWRVVMFQTPKKTWEFRVGKCMVHNHQLNHEDFRHIDPSPRHHRTHLTPVYPGVPRLDQMLMTPPMSPIVMTSMPLANLPDIQRALPPFASLQDIPRALPPFAADTRVLQQATLAQSQPQTQHFMFAHGVFPHMAMYDAQAGQAAANLVGLGIVHPNLAVTVAERQQDHHNQQHGHQQHASQQQRQCHQPQPSPPQELNPFTQQLRAQQAFAYEGLATHHHALQSSLSHSHEYSPPT